MKYRTPYPSVILPQKSEGISQNKSICHVFLDYLRGVRKMLEIR